MWISLQSAVDPRAEQELLELQSIGIVTDGSEQSAARTERDDTRSHVRRAARPQHLGVDANDGNWRFG